MPSKKTEPFDGVGAWNAYVQRNPLPDGRWWPLKWADDVARNGYADVSRTHPAVYGVWREQDGTYTVAVKAEARRPGPGGCTKTYPAHEVKRRRIADLLELRTLLITLANNPNTA